MQTLIQSYTYPAPIQRVWQSLTDTNEIREWYFHQLQKFEPVVGFRFVFSNDGSAYQKEWTVTRVEEGRLLAHSWVYKGYAGSSEVVFELVEEGEETRLILTHTGIESFPTDGHFARQRFVDGWKQILDVNLRKHLEEE